MFQTKRIFNYCTVSLQTVRECCTKPVLKTIAQRRQHYGDLFPEKLLSKKHKTPARMYIANKKTAENINKFLLPHFKQSSCDTIMELNPGAGLFTRWLLNNEQFKKIILMESEDYFINNLQELHTLYPDRVKVKQEDFVNINKLLFQDKIDNGARIQELLRDVPIKKMDEGSNMLLFGVVGSYNLFKHMINSIVFRNSFLSLGGTELYLVVPPPIYLHLTCTREIGYMIYRSTSILFQILFEYRFIACLPRDDFLPAQIEHNSSKGSKLERVRSVNPEFLYLVRIVPRNDIYKYVAAEDLPALWYFIKQNCTSRSTRIIPNIEKWIPRCGPRLIINESKPIPSVPMYDDENVSKLPQYSSRCHSINNRDYPNINIYTQFGDLTPNQMLTLFSLFRKWPEYKESSFLASFESSMIKMEPSSEASVIDEVDDDLSPDEATDEEETSGYVTQSSETANRNKKRNKN